MAYQKQLSDMENVVYARHRSPCVQCFWSSNTQAQHSYHYKVELVTTRNRRTAMLDRFKQTTSTPKHTLQDIRSRAELHPD